MTTYQQLGFEGGSYMDFCVPLFLCSDARLIFAGAPVGTSVRCPATVLTCNLSCMAGESGKWPSPHRAALVGLEPFKAMNTNSNN